MHRRSRYDPLAARPGPSWLVTSDMHWETLAALELPNDADLRAAFRRRVAELEAEGWQAEGDGLVHGFLFLSRPGGRIHLGVTALNPAEPFGAGHGYLAARVAELVAR